MKTTKASDDIYYEALRTRDSRFDGKFFVGVRTTGIYCRPICPAKPKRENVEFFANYLLAEKSGYRPCLRCRPESAPMSSAWIGTSAIVRRAVRSIGSVSLLDFNEDEFSSLFGVSARHLRRLCRKEVGKTPKQLFTERQLNFSRQLIVETNLKLSEVAFASGFKSVRRFNDAFKARFKRSPKMIRRLPIESETGLKISIPYRPPYDYEGLYKTYSAHRVGNLEYFENGYIHRFIEHEGSFGKIVLCNEPKLNRIVVEIFIPDLTIIHSLILNIRSYLDIDSDPLVVANALECDAKTKMLLDRYPGIRLPSGWSLFETAIAVILGQLVSVERGRMLVHDLIKLTGTPTPYQMNGEVVIRFPTPQELTHSDLTSLKTTRQRKKTLLEFSKAVDQGDISLDSTQDIPSFLEKVQTISGIGKWTANNMALRVLRHTDAFPATDLILNRALAIHSEKEIEKMSPWRAYAAALYWREYAQKLGKKK